MNPYEQKQAARKARLERASALAAGRSSAAFILGWIWCWSEPGETRGVRERYQSARCAELLLAAGSNHASIRDSRLVFSRDDAPWSVLRHVPLLEALRRGLGSQVEVIARGEEPTQDLARAAAEAAARRWLRGGAP